MEWNVYYHDTNKGTIDVINVFERLGMERFARKLFKLRTKSSPVKRSQKNCVTS